MKRDKYHSYAITAKRILANNYAIDVWKYETDGHEMEVLRDICIELSATNKAIYIPVKAAKLFEQAYIEDLRGLHRELEF